LWQQRIAAEDEALRAEVRLLNICAAETGRELDAFMPAVLDRAFKGELL
jgi:hypothetical protein